jgi:hypothetical protein
MMQHFKAGQWQVNHPWWERHLLLMSKEEQRGLGPRNPDMARLAAQKRDPQVTAL